MHTLDWDGPAAPANRAKIGEYVLDRDITCWAKAVASLIDLRDYVDMTQEDTIYDVIYTLVKLGWKLPAPPSGKVRPLQEDWLSGLFPE